MTGSQGKIEEKIIFSEFLQEEISFLVYLPPNYSDLYKYALLIAQDGRDYFQLGKLPRLGDELIPSKEIENTIMVGVPYKDVNDRRRKYHPEGEQNSAYIRFIAQELIPFLDREYPTYLMGQGRTLVGDSLAATVSLMTALHYPHSIGKVILQSPYVDEHVLNKVQQHKQPELLDVYHVIGTEETAVKTTDGEVKDFLKPNRELHKMMVEKGYSLFYEEFNGEHTWKYWQPDLKRALKMML
ncbi:hypothetical protein Q73_04240 [Bacillus coahuilensis m2-6]|uniref:alpha/beta hydrolase n=1 Tax=Bacillus coahuilensis TaxID=408580 RepID=UPI0001850F8E|nr:esterase family protein [Bacillus coahuilensis]KUP08938.1 hypothetical protein Q73_04240 [Bacillus coahuilensis m2-6]